MDEELIALKESINRSKDPFIPQLIEESLEIKNVNDVPENLKKKVEEWQYKIPLGALVMLKADNDGTLTGPFRVVERQTFNVGDYRNPIYDQFIKVEKTKPDQHMISSTAAWGYVPIDIVYPINEWFIKHSLTPDTHDTFDDIISSIS